MVSLQAALVAMAFTGAGQTVLLDFYSDSCGPCRAMDPTVQELAKMGFPVRKVNVEQDRALAAKFRVQAIPCFVMLVDGREVDRVVGGTSFSRLERMCKLGLGRPAPVESSPVLDAATGSAPRATPETTPMNHRVVPIPSVESGPPLSALTRQAAAQPPQRISSVRPSPVTDRPSPAPGWTARGAANAKSDARLLAASVRLRIKDPRGHSCGSGTIIDARQGEALILTCGHIFRDSQGKGSIEVDLFTPDGPIPIATGRPVSVTAEGQLISYNLDRDVGLVLIKTSSEGLPGQVVTARVAPVGYRVSPGEPVVSVGCNNGDRPSALHSRVTSLNKYSGPPNLEVAGLPVEGRSGGGLFSREGLVIGVCNAADPSDREGLYAALQVIHAELNAAKLAFVHQPSQHGQPSALAATLAPPMALADRLDQETPPMPKRMPPPSAPRSQGDWASPGVSEVSLSTSPAARWSPAENRPRLNVEEQAALDELLKRLEGGARVVCVVQSRRNPTARSEILVLENVSPHFLKRLATEARARETSLEIP